MKLPLYALLIIHTDMVVMADLRSIKHSKWMVYSLPAANILLMVLVAKVKCLIEVNEVLLIETKKPTTAEFISNGRLIY